MVKIFQDQPNVRISGVERRRVPARVALAVLPVAFVVTQLAGAVTRDVALWLLPVGVTGGGGATMATLLAMGATSAILLMLALGIPILRGLSFRDVFYIRTASLSVFIAAAVGTVALGPLADLLMAAMAAWRPDWTLGSVPMLHGIAQRYPLLVLWPFFALLPGVAEEAFFRGFFQGSFRNPAVAITAGGAAFALFHVDPHHVVGVLPLGLFLSWVAQQHGLLVTIMAHVVNNTVALCSAQVADLDIGYGTDTPLPFYWVPVGLGVSALAMGVLRAPYGRATHFPAQPDQAR